jgi:hypothetical protein
VASKETADQAAEEPQQDTEVGEQRAVLARVIATKELPRIRQRGLDGLDLTAHNQKPVKCERVEQLARVHSEKKGVGANSRPALVRSLIDDALSAYAEHNEASAKFIRRLFFSADDTATLLSPGDLLDEARKKSGLSASSFDRLRRKEFAKFAEFLAEFAVRDTTVSQETAQMIYRVPKGYRLEKVVNLHTRLIFAGIVIVPMITLTVLALPTLDRWLNKSFFPLKVASKSAQTYNEPSMDATKGQVMKSGVRVVPECVAEVVGKDHKLAYWVRIKTEPWKNYYVPATAFEGGENKAKSLVSDGVPFCPTK